MCLLRHLLPTQALSRQPKHLLWGQHILMHHRKLRPSQELFTHLSFTHYLGFAAAAQGGSVLRLLELQCSRTVRAMVGR